MKCIYCGCLDDKVIDSRVSDDGTSIRRRRECLGCGKRYTTYETVETTPIIVKAGEKRPVSMSDIDKLVNEIEMKIHNNFDGEVTTSQIGEYVMEGLKELDDVAYVRFAAIYRQFKDINSWLSEIQEVLKTKK